MIMEIDEERTSLLAAIDGHMQSLGGALNLIDPDGTFKGMPSEEMFTKGMQAIHSDYRKLSKAIYALRTALKEQERKEEGAFQSNSPADTSKNTGKEWTSKVLEKRDEVRAMGREPTKIIIPLYIQRSMISATFSLERPSESVTTFYGYPVEDGHEIAVQY